MIKELEEKYRIELRKKAILKGQCDQAYLRGVSAISMEALKMSNSTLADYYQGMKMPNYDGQDIMKQMRNLNNTTLQEQQRQGGNSQQD
jgi:membrane protease subunit (stomatin/prohibitin family)